LEVFVFAFRGAFYTLFFAASFLGALTFFHLLFAADDIACFNTPANFINNYNQPTNPTG